MDFVNKEDYIDPFNIEYTKIFKPPHISKRIIAQSGIFTVHKLIDNSRIALPLEKNKRYRNSRKKIIVPYKIFGDIRKDLISCGIHSSSLFPDLDSICKSLNEILIPEENKRRISDLFGMDKVKRIKEKIETYSSK